jgi:carboxyl-terminal processing protease
MRLPASRAILSLAIVVALSVGFVGIPGSNAQGTATSRASEIDGSLALFNRLLALVEQNSATEVDSEKAVYGAIDGMLRTLDPHSKFFNPKDFASLREDQRGRYFGLGIQVADRFGRITVVSPPFPESPAEKVGLRVGDAITHVNGEPTQGIGLTDVVNKLKGPRGTAVQVTIARPGADEPMQLSIIRDEIARYTITNAYMIRPRIGYIKLTSFAETTDDELQEALGKMDVRNLDGLVFDLRANPGGLLPQAIAVSETFLQKGQSIVETRGRTRGSNREYPSDLVNTENLFPLVILINENSASASEIVAGAIQDHDRGLIVGEPSFGKGLVQSVYPLQKQAGLALTTQKWYTPSGRLIQRDYSDISQFDYYNHREATAQPTTDIKYSDLGRIVYGGGGITPDHIVEMEKSNEFQTAMFQRFAFFTFVRDFLAKNPPVDAPFQVSEALLAEFKDHIQRRGITFTDADFEANKDFLKLRIRFEVFYNRLGTAEAERVLLESDPQVLKAIELLPEAKALQARAQVRAAELQR